MHSAESAYLPPIFTDSFPAISASNTTQQSPLFKPFAVSCGFHSTVVDVLYEMGYLYFVLDSFTNRLLPMMRPAFEGLVASLEHMTALEINRETLWRGRMQHRVNEIVS